jgi:cellulose synthase/poly-beta-1,6-N-acetylglucosamine synthase-like glycosyltransferase
MKSRVARTALIESLQMQKRPFFRWIFPAILGLLVGFLALAWAITSESNQPVSLVSFLSPGLKIAELVMPAAHESLAWTFGWFLRIAIGVNAIFYFSIFVLLAYLVDRRRSQNS